MPVTAVTVVIVDDQLPFRRVARAVIGQVAEFRVVGEAVTGETAVEMVAALRPALVLMDANLPGISGMEATRRILGMVPDTVVFMCSTYALDALPAAIAQSGARAYIDKAELDAALLLRLWAETRPSLRP